jgi:hypothetical protein
MAQSLILQRYQFGTIQMAFDPSRVIVPVR